MYEPPRTASMPQPQSGAQKSRETAAAKRYVQDTLDVMGYLRGPLKGLPLEAAYARLAAITLLEGLTLFRDAMQHNPAWVALDVPEPDLIATARGRAALPGLKRSLESWMRALAEPRNREHWCQRAFERSDLTIERQYYLLAGHAEAAMLLLFDSSLVDVGEHSFGLKPEGVELAVRLRDHPLDVSLLEQVRDLKPLRFF